MRVKVTNLTKDGFRFDKSFYIAYIATKHLKHDTKKEILFYITLVLSH